MNLSRSKRKFITGMLVTGGLCLAVAIGMSAQVRTEATTTTGQSAHQVTVERGEVVLVEGNDLVVKMADGSIRHIANVPDSARATVNGQELGIHDLKPGMKLERTITTMTTPRTITTVQSVTGTVWHVSPPSSVILSLEDGTNQSFQIPKGQKFNIDGKMVDAWGLKKGMKVSATKVVEVPETEVTQQRKVTGSMPPPPAPPPADMPILIVSTSHVPVMPPPSQAEVVPAKLPKTGSELPLIGVLGLALTGASFGMRFCRSKG